jgi:hypothetical protein
MSDGEKEIWSAESYANRIDTTLKTKEYHHWESEEQRELNRQLVDNYDEKKLAVNQASLQTQIAFLDKYSQYFDSDNIKRMSSDRGSNKTEIYSEPAFVAKIAPESKNGYIVTGIRCIPDGKICIRDTDNIESLKHTATHETMHDLSYQSSNQTVECRPGQDGIHTISASTVNSGIERFNHTSDISSEGKIKIEKETRNCYLNEGITEMYTIEAMQERGESPGFASYTDERAWALELRDHVGDDFVANAYFGGRIDALEERFNSMTDIPDAWNQLSANIDALHHERTSEKRNEYRKNIYNIFQSLNDDAIFERTRRL